MARSTVHYADNKTNTILKALHNKLRPAGTPVQRVEYIIELLLLRIFEVKLKQDKEFAPLRKLFDGNNYRLLFSHLLSLNGKQTLSELNKNFFPYYGDILGKARGIFKTNLPQKVQDQLVLIEEVFSNSSFTNNVKTGNLSEVISLVDDIDEARILKTDLLGDAIESALSEQGGTKDVGLFRTPDHIRQMMVVLADPNFKDIIFDPACGTGGFLFDTYQYVLEKVKKDADWPNEKAHEEIRKYLNVYTKKYEIAMPSSNVTNTFYRVGISGIEYLGMIRKMAAINLYIRGLNPQNIEQGDSLDMFDPGVDAGTKSVVIANPPFGAKLDQDAYPNVWEEYPKTDSTTLFVKLMFNHLRTGGRCAVVVSEGFLTWDSEAAKEMRRLLLEEANLKAIISLQQGVFVSKGGQGAKTSVLYYEKGEPTKNVWYYKITNDGYSMGVNRKEIAGCQIPEVLELFTKYIKRGKVPPKTKNSFTIPVDWIKQIDPRLKQRIVDETTQQQKEKFTEKRAKEIEKLDEKLKKDKITKKEYEEKLWQFDNLVENSIQNEITKHIEKAHSYSFNLQNYKSILSDDQIKKWQSAFGGIKIKNGANIDARYRELLKADSKIALQILASFNPESALEMDIAREYLIKLKIKSEKLKELKEILKEAQRFPLVEIGNFLIPKYEKIKKEDYCGDFDLVDKISFSDGKIHLRRNRETGMDLYKVKKGNLLTSKINLHQGAVAISDEDLMSSTHYQAYEIDQSEIIPKYLLLVMRSNKFLEILHLEKAGGIKNESGADFLMKFQIPLPPLEKQREIVEKIERQKAIIEGVKNILENWQINKTLFDGGFEQINYPSNLIVTGGTPSRQNQDYFKGNNNWFKSGELRNAIIFNSVEKITNEAIKNSNARLLPKNTVLIALIGATMGDVAILAKEGGTNQNVGAFMPWKKCDSKYLFWFLSFFVEDIKKQKKEGAQPNLNLDNLKKLKIILPPAIIQKQIVAQLDKEMETLGKVRELKKHAEERINKILEEVWGE